MSLPQSTAGSIIVSKKGRLRGKSRVPSGSREGRALPETLVIH